jgi:hypothetical protein
MMTKHIAMRNLLGCQIELGQREAGVSPLADTRLNLQGRDIREKLPCSVPLLLNSPINASA